MHDIPKKTIDSLLGNIQKSFYQQKSPRYYHRDRNMLLYTLSWPASWLAQRNLKIKPSHYQAIIENKLKDIQTYADPEKYNTYFPRYLLKCLQEHFIHHGDELYFQLKHLSHSISNIMNHMESLQQAPLGQDIVKNLASVHHILHRRYSKSPKNVRQLELF